MFPDDDASQCSSHRGVSGRGCGGLRCGRRASMMNYLWSVAASVFQSRVLLSDNQLPHTASSSPPCRPTPFPSLPLPPFTLLTIRAEENFPDREPDDVFCIIHDRRGTFPFVFLGHGVIKALFFFFLNTPLFRLSRRAAAL